MNHRQIILDTETTGLNPKEGHRIIEIACVEMIDRTPTKKHFHYYLNPDRAIDDEAIKVHGITQSFLSDKPRFADIANELFAFLQGAELVIHNAAFDLGFINHEFLKIGIYPLIETICSVVDTLEIARKLHPGQRNSLDALCKRYHIDNTERQLHGALLDSHLLLNVYLAMTGGQGSLFKDNHEATETIVQNTSVAEKANHHDLLILFATEQELTEHESYLKKLAAKNNGHCVWNQLNQEGQST